MIGGSTRCPLLVRGRSFVERERALSARLARWVRGQLLPTSDLAHRRLEDALPRPDLAPRVWA